MSKAQEIWVGICVCTTSCERTDYRAEFQGETLEFDGREYALREAIISMQVWNDIALARMRCTFFVEIHSWMKGGHTHYVTELIMQQLKKVRRPRGTTWKYVGWVKGYRTALIRVREWHGAAPVGPETIMRGMEEMLLCLPRASRRNLLNHMPRKNRQDQVVEPLI